MTIRHVAVIDIGKTNAKLALVDLQTQLEIAVVTRANTVLPGPPYPHFDEEGHWKFLLQNLTDFQNTHGIDAISVTTHGACAVLLDAQGSLATPVLDYEYHGPDDMRVAYDIIRPAFELTGSPALPGGLNLGAQLHWLFANDPSLYARTAHIVTYPQYWGFRLTGQTATDMTSLGCHTDLWCPQASCFSSLVDDLRIRDRIALPRKATDRLGQLSPALAAQTGLSRQTPVACGIHDSNASLYPHLISRPAPFSVVSTGTWIVAMGVAGDDVVLDPARDTLINVDARGAPVRSARLMGGRTYDILTKGVDIAPSIAEQEAVLHAGTMLIPSVVRGSGPFPDSDAYWIGEEPPTGSPARAAAIGFHLALMTAYSLSLIGARGPTVVEGAFSRNAPFLNMLAAATDRPVIATASTTGTSLGAALLFSDGVTTAAPPNDRTIMPDQRSFWQSYAKSWKTVVTSGPL